jgi:hypothetical protein
MQIGSNEFFKRTAPDWNGADSPVSAAEGYQMKEALGAFDYMECSAIKCEGVKDAFDRAIVHAINRPGKGGCYTVQ